MLLKHSLLLYEVKHYQAQKNFDETPMWCLSPAWYALSIIKKHGPLFYESHYVNSTLDPILPKLSVSKRYMRCNLHENGMQVINE